MGSGDVKFIISGKDAEIVAEEIRDIIEKEFGTKQNIIPYRKNKGNFCTKDVDPFTVTAVVLAIPGAVLAVVDLIDKIKKKKQLDRVLEKVIKRVETCRSDTKVQKPDGTVVEVHRVDSVEIVESVNRKEG